MGLITDFVSTLIYEAVAVVIDLFLIKMPKVFYMEDLLLTNIMDTDGINKTYLFMSGMAIVLVLIKLLQKGIMTYVLLRDGDPDGPLELNITNLGLSIAAIICFPYLYGLFVEVSVWMIENVAYSANDLTDENAWLVGIESIVTAGLLYIIILLIYLICVFVLYLQFVKRSAELLILRMAFPLACLGLLDSDNGVFSSTIKIFIQVTLTTAAQIFFMCFSASLLIKSGGLELFTAIACVMAAFSTPRMFQQILLPVGGGNAMYKMSSVMHMTGLLKSLRGG